jgi:hypothetical protein
MAKLTEREHLEEYTTRPENIEALEDSLYWNYSEYQRLEAQKDKLRLNKPLDREKVYSLFEEVTHQTREFLGLTPSQVSMAGLSVYDWRNFAPMAAKIGGGVAAAGVLISLGDGVTAEALLKAAGAGGMFSGVSLLYAHGEYSNSSYLPPHRMINIGEKTERGAVDAIAFAYDYHVLADKTHISTRGRNPIVHGHVMGVRKGVGEIMAEKRDNEGFRLEPLKHLLPELKEAYLFACDQTGRTPRSSLILRGMPSGRTGPLRVGLLYDKIGHPADMGTAAMSIAEQKYGSRVYGQVVREDYSFLRL